MWRNLKIQNKILIVIVAVAVVIMAIGEYLGDADMRLALRHETFNKLTAFREMKADQIEDYIRLIADQARTLSEDRMTIDALRAFRQGFAELEPGNAADVGEADERLRDYYREEFISELDERQERSVILDDYWPGDPRTRALQDRFIATNPHPTGSKSQLDDPDDDSEYARAHSMYHPVLRSYLERFGYYDIFLVDADSGHIVYSVAKEVDFATSLLGGPYRDTNFARAFRQARQADFKDFVRLVDFEPYDPSYGDWASFIASPVFDGDEKIGVLVFQMPVGRINNIMTSKQDWHAVGLGNSGETYIVGSDRTLRNQSRMFIEDSEAYLDHVDKSGLSRQVIDAIRSNNSTIGLQRVDTPGATYALNGDTGTTVFEDYRGITVFSAYGPLDIPGVEWAILSEIDESEALAPLAELRRKALFSFLVLLALILIVSTLFARSLTTRLKALTAQAEKIAAGSTSVAVDISGNDEIGALARSFSTMQQNVHKLITRQQRSIEALSTPIIPLHDQVIALPMVGELDDSRLAQVAESLSESLHKSIVRFAILDFTGVPHFSRELAHGLGKLVRMTNLLGAKVILTGINPQMANELASDELKGMNVEARSTLSMGIEYATELMDS